MCEKNFKDGKKFRGQNHPNLLMPAVPEAVILLDPLFPHTCCIHSSLCSQPQEKPVLKNGMWHMMSWPCEILKTLWSQRQGDGGEGIRPLAFDVQCQSSKF